MSAHVGPDKKSQQQQQQKSDFCTQVLILPTQPCF